MDRTKFLAAWDTLTTRQKETVYLMSEGMTEPEIAECYGVAIATIKARKRVIYHKLGMKGRFNKGEMLASVYKEVIS